MKALQMAGKYFRRRKMSKTKMNISNPFRIISFLLLAGILFQACDSEENNDSQGQEEFLVYNQKQLPEFKFMNQDSQWVNKASVMGKIHVMDFFFTSCPTICPVMKANMLTVYEKFEHEDRLVMVSHSIDPRHDSVPVLHDYAERLNVKAPRWHFVTGEKEKIMGIARDYMVSAMEDKNEPGGFAHSGKLILFDEEHNIRGFYDGTSEHQTQELIKAISHFLNE